jgi:hypothetical protein
LPTYGKTNQFKLDYSRLSEAERSLFKRAVGKFVEDLKRGGDFRRSLRVKSMQGNPSILEMTWEGENGRATFEFGEPIIEGEPHVVWRHVGGHEVFGSP